MSKETLQEIHKRIYTHLIQQGEPSIVRVGEDPEDVSCKYRTRKGERTLMCAAGCLIKDEHYHASFEGESAIGGPVQEALQHSGVPIKGDADIARLVRRWQIRHDDFVRGDARDNDWTVYVHMSAREVEKALGLETVSL